MVMRMADADVIPYQFTNLAETVHGYLTDLKKLASTARDKAKEQNTEISEDVYKALYDPKKQFVPPTTQPLPPYFNVAPLEQASTIPAAWYWDERIEQLEREQVFGGNWIAVGRTDQVAVAGQVTGPLAAGQVLDNPTGPNSFVAVYNARGEQVWRQERDGLAPNQANSVAFGAAPQDEVVDTTTRLARRPARLPHWPRARRAAG